MYGARVHIHYGMLIRDSVAHVCLNVSRHNRDIKYIVCEGWTYNLTSTRHHAQPFKYEHVFIYDNLVLYILVYSTIYYRNILWYILDGYILEIFFGYVLELFLEYILRIFNFRTCTNTCNLLGPF